MYSLITDAGDSGLLLPMALVASGALWLLHSRRLAWLLARSVLAAGLAITALKILFLSCAAHWVPGLASPSGHACLSAVVYGCLATVLAAGRPRPMRWLIGLGAVLFVAVIAVSRLTLGVHTLVEVLVGLAVGGVAQAWFARSFARLAPLRIEGRLFGLALAGTVLLAFGLRLPAESLLRHAARRIAFNCPGASSAPALPQPARSSAPRSSASERASWS